MWTIIFGILVMFLGVAVLGEVVGRYQSSPKQLAEQLERDHAYYRIVKEKDRIINEREHAIYKKN